MGKKKLDLTAPKTKAEEDLNLRRRLPGLLKKANQIGNLTCCKVLLIVFDNSYENLSVFSNDYMDIFYASYQKIINDAIINENKESTTQPTIAKITNNCQFIDPEKKVLSFSFDLNESYQMNEISFYKENIPYNKLLFSQDCMPYYVPMAKKISYAQYKRKKEAEKAREFNTEKKHEYVLGKPIPDLLDRDNVLSTRDVVSDFWVKNQTGGYLPNSDLKTLDNLFRINSNFGNFGGLHKPRRKSGLSDSEDDPLNEIDNEDNKKYKIFESLME